MEIILKQDVKNLGYTDDVVKVRDGYGANFLIPQGHAILATESAKKVHAETLRQRAGKETKTREQATKTADALKEVSLQIGTKAGDSGKIFGSVNTIQIAEALKKAGYDIDRKNITIDEEHIKALGTYTAKVKVYKDIQTSVSFEVVAE
ncbi:MAG: 50S ribosomal protein L9 [Sphingobacteriales bacterium JAD_PAG50586_3]|nr:MAG: 50S ribosomal protein L9 [Sphingobacteriales bacterium JAD_PAG50586_3]